LLNSYQTFVPHKRLQRPNCMKTFKGGEVW